MSEKSDFETILKWVVMVILAIVALKVLATVLGIAFLLGGFLLTRVLPLIVLVWVVLKVVQWLGRKEPASDL
jgi:F0F1-type ATP synthase assembly protein I